ncbi:type III pantothenate kinase [bacterium]|nr:type III pantothenate kinase [bacterium]
MLVAIDVRNKVITVGLGAQGAWAVVRKLGTLYQRTADEYAMFFRFLMEEARAVLPAAAAKKVPDGVWISSVVPSLTPAVAEGAREVFGQEPRLIGPGVKTGIKIRTDQPAELGADLVCQAAAGRDLTASAFVVVDFGVAITISAVNQGGEFLGCAIAPGLEASAETLRLQAVQIPEVKLEFPPRAIGRSTAESVRSGILLGFEGLVSRLLEAMDAELRAQGASAVEVFGTGDAAGRELLERLGRGRFEPCLALDGIAAIARRTAALPAATVSA